MSPKKYQWPTLLSQQLSSDVSGQGEVCLSLPELVAVAQKIADSPKYIDSIVASAAGYKPGTQGIVSKIVNRQVAIDQVRMQVSLRILACLPSNPNVLATRALLHMIAGEVDKSRALLTPDARDHSRLARMVHMLLDMDTHPKQNNNNNNNTNE